MAKADTLSFIPQDTLKPTFSYKPGELGLSFWQPHNASVSHIAIVTFLWDADGQVPRFLFRLSWEMYIICPLHAGPETQLCSHPSPGCPRVHTPPWVPGSFLEIFSVNGEGGKLSPLYSLPSSGCSAPPCHMCSPKRDTDTAVEFDLYGKE